MAESNLDLFIRVAEKASASVLQNCDTVFAATYISEHLTGTLLLPHSPSLQRLGIQDTLTQAGVNLVTGDVRQQAAAAGGGLTGANFGIADTGTIVLESTDEATRLASTLPEQHFVLLDPGKILVDGIAAVAPLRALHQRDACNFIAYITGPSRTADIERVLTIGVHGPKQLHILLLPGISDDLLEN
jgi:L-lactate dehydrogenase complex protein LldG